MKAERRMTNREWAKVRLDECAEIVAGATPSTSVAAYWDGDVCWATPKDLSELDGAHISDTPRKLTRAGLDSCAATILPAGSVLFSSRAPIGHVAVNTVPMATNQGFKSFVPKPERLSAKFLYWWLRTNRSYLESLGNGATFKEVSKAVVSRIQIPLPSLSDQRRIAEVLDRAEALRAKRRAALAQLDSLTQSIFLDLFGNPAMKRTKWKESAVGDVTDCIVPGRDKPKSFSGKIPWITTDDLRHLELTHDSPKGLGLNSAEIGKVRARIIPKGSVIISCVGDLGIISIAGKDIVINQQLHSFQCHENLNNVFLMHCLAFQRAFMYAKASSTTLPYMNKSVCNSIPIFVPPIGLQREFARRVQAVEKLKAAQRASLAELNALFASLQHRAFRGEL